MRKVLTLATGCVLLAMAGCGPRDRVASVGGHDLTREDFNAFAAENPLPAATSAREGLDALVNQEVAAEAARRGQMDKDLSYVLKTRAFERDLLASEVLRTHFATEINPSEEAIHAAFMQMNEKRNLRHILVKDGAQAQAICRAVSRGADFGQQARQFSQDQGSGKAGGELGWQSAAALDPAFVEQAFSLKEGEISKPFQTRFGWHVVQCLGVQNADPAGLESQRDQVKTLLQKSLAQNVLDKAAQEAMKKLPVAIIAESLDGDFGLQIQQGDDGLTVATAGQKGKVSMADLKDYMGDYFTSRGNMHVMGPSAKKEFLGILLKSAVLAEQARAEGLDRRPDMAARVHQRERALLAEAMRGKTLAEAVVPRERLDAWLASKPKELAPEEELHLFYMTFGTEGEAARAAAEVAGGMRFQDAVSRFSSKTGPDAGSGDAGWTDASHLIQAVGKEAVEAILQAPPARAVGPFQTAFGWQVFMVEARRPGAAHDLDKDHDLILNAYRRKFSSTLWEEHLADWRREFKVKVYPKNLRMTPGVGRQ